MERFKFASVSEVAKIKSEIVRSREEKGAAAPEYRQAGQPEPEKGPPEKSDADKLVDELLGAPVHKEGEKTENPFPAKTEKSLLSEPTSGRHSKAEEGISKSADTKNGGKPSVRQELREIQERRKAQGERAGLDQNRGGRKEKETSSKNQQKSTRHRQPVWKKKTRGKAR